MKFAAKLLSSHTDPCFQWIRTRYMQNDIPTQPRQEDTAIWRTFVTLVLMTVQMAKVIIGSGASTMFWKDNWTTLGRFQLTLPTLFTFAPHPNCIVRSQRMENNWVISLQPVLSQQTASEYQFLQDFLSTQSLQSDSLDQRVSISTMTAPTTSTFYRTLSFHGIKWAAKDYTWNRSIPHNYRIFL